MDREDRDLGPNAHPAEGDEGMQGAPRTGAGDEGISREADRAGGYGYDRPADAGEGEGEGEGMSGSPVRNDDHVVSNRNATGSNRPNERDRATGTPAEEAR